MIYDYIALDVETTGLDPAKNKILEIGAVRVKDGKVCETYGTLIDTGMPVPSRVEKLTGITDDMRRAGKKTEVAIREFLAFCEELPVLGHNVKFDFGFLKQTAVNEGLSFEREALDTLKIARRVLPDIPSRTLSALCDYYQVNQGNAHRALDDALATHEVLWKMWEEFKDQDPYAFRLQRLFYTPKKQSPITISQKRYLNDLRKYHKIESDICIENITKSEASRLIDQIILQYGRIM